MYNKNNYDKKRIDIFYSFSLSFFFVNNFKLILKKMIAENTCQKNL